jgi:hypothetical protein
VADEDVSDPPPASLLLVERLPELLLGDLAFVEQERPERVLAARMRSLCFRQFGSLCSNSRCAPSPKYRADRDG